tara:strand:- start:712 stop:2316 length:1605 start_codon:yes stop_codon:yes gene_type:complete
MNEGTSIGEIENIENFDLKSNNGGSVDDYGLKATKIGERSEFEKEFMTEDVSETYEPQKEEEKKPEIKTLKNELEKFLDEETAQVFDYEDGDVIQGTVRSVEKSGVLVDFNFKSDGYVSNSELGYDENGKTEVLEAGQKVPFFIDKLETKEGYSLLSRKKAQIEESWDFLLNAVKDRDPVDVSVVSKVDGGLVASYQSIRGFIPASQILKENDLGLDQFIDSTMSVTVLQADRRRRKVIFSSKATKLSNKQHAGKLLEELEVGQTRKGKVTSIKKFGVFVDLGGIEGLIHISELSWSRVNNPADIVSLDDEINVFVLGVDRETRRISLGMKQLNEDPWVQAGSQYSIGDIIDGVITRIVPFGAFMKINDNIEGLIHISEMSYDHIERVENVLKVGEAVKAKIIKLIIDEQKIGLTLKYDENQDGKSNQVQAKESDSIAETAEETEPVAKESDSVAETAEETEPVAKESDDKKDVVSKREEETVTAQASDITEASQAEAAATDIANTENQIESENTSNITNSDAVDNDSKESDVS